MTCTITSRTGNDLVQSLQARARRGSFQTNDWWQLVIPRGQERLRYGSRTTSIWLRDDLQIARLPACLQRYLPYLIIAPRNQVHIGTQIARHAPALIAPQIYKLADTLLLDIIRLPWRRNGLSLLPVVARLVNNLLKTLRRLARAFRYNTPDIFYTLVYIILIIWIRLTTVSSTRVLPILVAHEFMPPLYGYNALHLRNNIVLLISYSIYASLIHGL